jgi:hypothetical protein
MRRVEWTGTNQPLPSKTTQQTVFPTGRTHRARPLDPSREHPSGAFSPATAKRFCNVSYSVMRSSSDLACSR